MTNPCFVLHGCDAPIHYFMDHGRKDGFILPEDAVLHQFGDTWKNQELKGNSGLKMSSDKSSRNLLQYHNRKSSAHCYREIYKTLVRFMVNIYIKSFISLRQQYLEDPHEGYSEKNINGQIQ